MGRRGAVCVCTSAGVFDESFAVGAHVIRVVTKKKKKNTTQNTIPVSEYVVAATCAPEGRGEDQLVILLYYHTGTLRTIVCGKRKHHNQSQTVYTVITEAEVSQF